jgi:hypothetical protein
MAQWDRVDASSVLERNLDREVPSSVQQAYRPHEHAVIVVRGVDGAIVATNERVFIEVVRGSPSIIEYHDLAGATAYLPWIGSRSVVLTGPGIRHAASVRFRDRSAAQRSVRELNAVVDFQNGWEDPDNPTHSTFMAGGMSMGRNFRRGRVGRRGR